MKNFLSIVLFSFFAGATVFAASADLSSCALPEPFPSKGDPSDCSFTATNPDPYPADTLYTIQVVVHVIMDAACAQGAFTDEQVISQIDILNEDFLALPGTPGALGADAQIRFELAESDPDGQPTDGITRSCNTTWYNDGGEYWVSLAWDPNRYLNIYTNTASNARGYVPFLPAAGNAAIGTNADRVVVNHLVFGRDSAFPPHDQGRTATHEVGHYLGLFHPYFGGCGVATQPECYTTGDLICDTQPDAQSHDECPVGATSCSGTDVPIDNYMELTDDLCMERFTVEQTRRMRCTLINYRPDLFSVGSIFEDGFESGDVSAWSNVQP